MMLKSGIDIEREFLTLIADVEQSKGDIRELRQEMMQLRREFAEVSWAVERLTLETQSDRESAAAERRIQQLEIDNRFLRHERGLPPADKPNENEK